MSFLREFLVEQNRLQIVSSPEDIKNLRIEIFADPKYQDITQEVSLFVTISSNGQIKVRIDPDHDTTSTRNRMTLSLKKIEKRGKKINWQIEVPEMFDVGENRGKGLNELIKKLNNILRSFENYNRAKKWKEEKIEDEKKGPNYSDPPGEKKSFIKIARHFFGL